MRSRSKRTPPEVQIHDFPQKQRPQLRWGSFTWETVELIHSFSRIHSWASLKTKAGHSWSSGTLPTLLSSGMSPLTGFSLLFCLWLMLFSSFSRTRPRRENLGECYLSLKMSSCSWYSVKSLWNRRFCPITGRSSFNSSLFRKPCTKKPTKACSECIAWYHKYIS